MSLVVYVFHCDLQTKIDFIILYKDIMTHKFERLSAITKLICELSREIMFLFADGAKIMIRFATSSLTLKIIVLIVVYHLINRPNYTDIYPVKVRFLIADGRVEKITTVVNLRQIEEY